MSNKYLKMIKAMAIAFAVCVVLLVIIAVLGSNGQMEEDWINIVFAIPTVLSLFAMIALLVWALIVEKTDKNKAVREGKSISRFQILLPFDGDKEAMAQTVHNFLVSKKYHPVVYRTENVYKQGTGMMTAGKYFKFSLVPEGFYIEAFVILFGMKEEYLEGFSGIVSKYPLRKLTEEVIKMISGQNR